jgi:hypothetical protein
LPLHRVAGRVNPIRETHVAQSLGISHITRVHKAGRRHTSRVSSRQLPVRRGASPRAGMSHRPNRQRPQHGEEGRRHQPQARSAVRAASSSPLGAALQLTLPPAHGTPPGSRHGVAETPTHCGATFTAVTHPPLSPQRSASTHRTPCTRRWQCESRSDVAACLDQGGQQRLGGGRTVGV